MMFEAGKKYIYIFDKTIYECIFVGDYRAFMRGNNKEVAPLKTNFRNSWKEYKEPQKIVLYLGFYTNPNGRLYNGGHLYRTRESVPLIDLGNSLNGIHEIIYEEKLK